MLAFQSYIACLITFGVCASGLSGLVITLSDVGELRVSYMGTDPPVGAVNPVDAKELNYDDMDEEHRKLLGIIRETQSGVGVFVRVRASERKHARSTFVGRHNNLCACAASCCMQTRELNQGTRFCCEHKCLSRLMRCLMAMKIGAQARPQSPLKSHAACSSAFLAPLKPRRTLQLTLKSLMLWSRAKHLL